MNNKEYEQKKLECWKQFCKENSLTDKVHILAPTAFAYAFDRAYTLGKQEKDVEGEEMLMCKKSKVQEVYKTSKEIVNNELYGTCQYSMHTQIMCVLENLFGSKCLLDEDTDCTPVEVGVAENATTSNVDSSYGNVESLEPKPSIPKFKHKLGDKVRIVNDWSYGYKHNGEVTEIIAIDESDPEVPYKVDIYDEEEGGNLWYQESDLEPYTEPILQPFSQVKETAASTIPVTESDKLSKLKDALLKLEEASKQVREELTKLNEK